MQKSVSTASVAVERKLKKLISLTTIHFVTAVHTSGAAANKCVFLSLLWIVAEALSAVAIALCEARPGHLWWWWLKLMVSKNT